MKYFVIAGEASGDLHGSNLIRNILIEDPEAEITCWGGEMMHEAGGKLIRHYRDTAYMGVWEVLKNLHKVMGNFDLCRQQISEFKPDVVILIDYPGFNLRIARYARRMNLSVCYYISPKFWAWGESRVRKVKKYVDRMYIIFPFEVGFYQRHGIEARYFGNPLIDQIDGYRKVSGDAASIREELGLGEKPVVALLAGSRQQEVKHVLPEMAGISTSFPDYQFAVAAMKHLPEDLYRQIIGDLPVKILNGRTYDLLSVAEAALVTSGTATLETALFDVPQVVCYRTSRLNYHIMKWAIGVRFISLVNLIMDKEIVRELIQDDLNRKNLNRELSLILRSGYKHEAMKVNYASLKHLLGDSGASSRIADDIVRAFKGAGIPS